MKIVFVLFGNNEAVILKYTIMDLSYTLDSDTLDASSKSAWRCLRWLLHATSPPPK